MGTSREWDAASAVLLAWRLEGAYHRARQRYDSHVQVTRRVRPGHPEVAMKKTITVTCPHCDSSLDIDSVAAVVVAHTPPVRHTDKIDFEARLKQMQDEKARSADRLAEAMRQERSKGRLMEDKFKALMDKAKDDDDESRPLRDIDLD
jgi:hypothetical protein